MKSKQIFKTGWWILLLLMIPVSGFTQDSNHTVFLTLRGSVSRALQKNNQLQASHYGLKKAQWDRYQAWTQLLPTVSFNTRFTRIDEESFYLRDFFRQNIHAFFPNLPDGFEIPPSAYRNAYASSIDVSMPIFNGILLNGLLIANANKKAMEKMNESTRNNILFQVISSYLNVLKSKELLRLQEEFLTLSRLNYEKAERKYQAGRYSKTEALRWKVDYQQQKSSVTSSQSALRTSTSVLTRMINMDMNQSVDVEKTIPQIILDEADRLAALPEEQILTLIRLSENHLLKANAALSAVSSQTRVNKLLYRNSYASYMPNISLSYSHGWRENNTLALDDYSPKTVMVNFNLPLFTSFQNLTKTKSSYYEYKQSRENYQDQLKNTRFILTETVNKIINLKTQRELSHATVEFTRNNYNVIEQQKERGLISNIDFIDAKLNLQNAELNDINNQYDFISAMVELYYLLGKLDKIVDLEN